MHLADTLIIAAYMITRVGIGIRVSGRQKTTDSYFIAGRTVPGWAAGLSLLATIITSLTFIAFPGAAYAGDWNLLVPGILFVIVILSIGPIIVPFFRRVVSMSVYEYFGKRFGPAVRMYSSFAFAAGHFAKMGFVFYLLALAGALPVGPSRFSSSASASSPSSTRSSAAFAPSSGPMWCRAFCSGPESLSRSSCYCSRRRFIPAQ